MLCWWHLELRDQCRIEKNVSMTAIITKDVRTGTRLKSLIEISMEKKITCLPSVTVVIHKVHFDNMRELIYQ